MTNVDAAEIAELKTRSADLISSLSKGGRDDLTRDALIADLLSMQARAIPAYGRLVHTQKRGPRFPAIPTDVFRFTRVSVHDEQEDVHTFHTSGTTNAGHGKHHFRDLALYDQAAKNAAEHALFRGGPIRMIILAPSTVESPHSSLSHMLHGFTEWFGTRSTYVWKDGQLDLELLRAELAQCTHDKAPVALLGTSFAFVHACEGLDARLKLPEGSLVMQTGGFKGRAREVAPAKMRDMLEERFSVPAERIVAEYGMTELSSQMYETCLIDPEGPRRLWIPGWVRVELVDPETLLPADSDTGLIRIEDAANVDSVAAIQTSDVGRRVGDGFEVLGRAPGSVPRGCSLAVDAALGSTGG